VTPTFRPATRGDLPAIAAVERAVFTDPWSAASFETMLRNEAVRVELAEDATGGALLGYTVAWFAADEVELANLAVALGARRRGLGRALLDRLVHAARARGARRLLLEVRTSNHAALALYGEAGFAQVGVRRRYYKNPEEDARVLALGLGG
jgi:ribosomal-protein-alanine N-acetyltransferase